MATIIRGLLISLVLAASHWLCACSATEMTSEPMTCNDPARQRLEELWQREPAWTHDSLFQMDGMTYLATPLSNVSSHLVQVRRSSLLSSTCPFGSRTRAELDGYRKAKGGNITLCPAHDVLNHDDNRIPTTVFEKGCSCSKCGFMQGVEEAIREHHSTYKLRCIPVHYYARVLRRVGCTDGVFVYRPVLEPLAVACACQGRVMRVHSETGKRK